MSHSEEPVTKEEYLKIRRNFRILGGVALLVVGTGATFYHYSMGLKWLDAVYFSTITLTTVGYGDIVPTNDAAKIFTIGYLIVGIGIIASFANLLLKNAVTKRQYKKELKEK